MKIKPAYLLLLFSFFYLFIKGQTTKHSGIPDGEQQAYINGKIYTVNNQNPWAEAILVEDGKIIAVGNSAQILQTMKPSASQTDLAGKLVLPGLHDVHMHPLEAGSSSFNFSLDQTGEVVGDYLPAIEQAHLEHPEGWLIGWGFSIYVLLEGNEDPKTYLDKIAPNRPIIIMEETSHSVWANTKALEEGNFHIQRKDPPGGIIMRNAQGESNGLLIDNAGNLLIDLAMDDIPNSSEQDYRGLIEFALPELAKHGITSICDARTYWKRNHHETWKRIEKEGKLTARVNLGLWAYPAENDFSQLNMLEDLYSFDTTSLLKINQIKVYADGIIINTTSAMLNDYKIDLFNQPTNKGLNYFDQERLEKYIQNLAPLGFDFHIHAIGNRGVRESLNAIEKTSGPNDRHRLTHVEYIDSADLARFQSLNVTADAQVAGGFSQPKCWHESDDLIDNKLNERVIPIKDLVQAGARLSLSSDWDVSTLNPFVGLQNAVIRIPQEISLAEAIKAYTLNAAYVMRQEHITGSIEIGKAADFIILDQNIFEINASQIKQTNVLETYLAGTRIY